MQRSNVYETNTFTFELTFISTSSTNSKSDSSKGRGKQSESHKDACDRVRRMGWRKLWYVKFYSKIYQYTVFGIPSLAVVWR